MRLEASWLLVRQKKRSMKYFSINKRMKVNKMKAVCNKPLWIRSQVQGSVVKWISNLKRWDCLRIKLKVWWLLNIKKYQALLLINLKLLFLQFQKVRLNRLYLRKLTQKLVNLQIKNKRNKSLNKCLDWWKMLQRASLWKSVIKLNMDFLRKKWLVITTKLIF